MRATLAMLCAMLIAAPVPVKAQSEAVHSIGRFVFENGGDIPDMKVGYVTWGTLNTGKSNAILLIPGTSGGRHSFDPKSGG